MQHTASADVAADLMTTSAVARALNRSEGAIRAAAARGTLPHIRLSTGLRLFRRQDIEDALERRAQRNR